jgi:hypothetical protein
MLGGIAGWIAGYDLIGPAITPGVRAITNNMLGLNYTDEQVERLSRVGAGIGVGTAASWATKTIFSNVVAPNLVEAYGSATIEAATDILGAGLAVGQLALMIEPTSRGFTIRAMIDEAVALGLLPSSYAASPNYREQNTVDLLLSDPLVMKAIAQLPMTPGRSLSPIQTLRWDTQIAPSQRNQLIMQARTATTPTSPTMTMQGWTAYVNTKIDPILARYGFSPATQTGLGLWDSSGLDQAKFNDQMLRIATEMSYDDFSKAYGDYKANRNFTTRTNFLERWAELDIEAYSLDSQSARLRDFWGDYGATAQTDTGATASLLGRSDFNTLAPSPDYLGLRDFGVLSSMPGWYQRNEPGQYNAAMRRQAIVDAGITTSFSEFDLGQISASQLFGNMEALLSPGTTLTATQQTNLRTIVSIETVSAWKNYYAARDAAGSSLGKIVGYASNGQAIHQYDDPGEIAFLKAAGITVTFYPGQGLTPTPGEGFGFDEGVGYVGIGKLTYGDSPWSGGISAFGLREIEQFGYDPGDPSAKIEINGVQYHYVGNGQWADAYGNPLPKDTGDDKDTGSREGVPSSGGQGNVGMMTDSSGVQRWYDFKTGQWWNSDTGTWGPGPNAPPGRHPSTTPTPPGHGTDPTHPTPPGGIPSGHNPWHIIDPADPGGGSPSPSGVKDQISYRAFYDVQTSPLGDAGTPAMATLQKIVRETLEQFIASGMVLAAPTAWNSQQSMAVVNATWGALTQRMNMGNST